MDQAYAMVDDAVNAISKWHFKKMADDQSGDRSYSDKLSELRRQQKRLDFERQEFLREKAFEEKRLEREKRIFDMEWKMLEEGWRSLAAEREQLERTHPGGLGDEESDLKGVAVSMFFTGVKNIRSLKKRYKDLIKIYHPDNVAGDTKVLQVINQEYESLRERLEGPRSSVFHN